MPQNFAIVIMSTNPSQSNLVPSKIHKQRPKGLSNGRLGSLLVSKRTFKTQTALRKNVQLLIDVSVKRRTEMSQIQADRPINHVFWTQSFSTDLSKPIQAVHKKSVDKWWDPKAGRPREANQPHFSVSQAQLHVEVTSTSLLAYTTRAGLMPTLEHYK